MKLHVYIKKPFLALSLALFLRLFLALFLFLFLFPLQCRNKPEYVPSEFPGKPSVPAILKKQHDDLLAQLSAIKSYQDSTGRSAAKLYDLMTHHFKEEEDYVLPAIGLLPMLAGGNIPGERKDIMAMIGRFKENSTHIIAEHQLIHAYVAELMVVAARENHSELVAFEKALRAHSGEEEEIFFPAVILIGEYLELKTGPQ